MKSWWAAEPTRIISIVSAGLSLAIGFGLNITTQQMGLIMAFVIAVLGQVNRSQVTSPQTLADMTPATLKAAQAAPEAVKDTVRKLP